MHQRRVDLASPAHRSLLDDLDAACPVIDATAIHHSFKAGDVLDTVTQCLAPPWRQALIGVQIAPIFTLILKADTERGRSRLDLGADRRRRVRRSLVHSADRLAGR